MDRDNHFDIVNLIHKMMIDNDIKVRDGVTAMLHVICEVCHSSGVEKDEIIRCLIKMYDSI